MCPKADLYLFNQERFFDEKENIICTRNAAKCSLFSRKISDLKLRSLAVQSIMYMTSYACSLVRSKPSADTLNLSAFPRTLVQGEKDLTDYDFGKR